MSPRARAWSGPSSGGGGPSARRWLFRVGRPSVAARKLVFHSIGQTHMNIARHDRHTTLFHHQVASTAAAAWCATAFR